MAESTYNIEMEQENPSLFFLFAKKVKKGRKKC